MVLFGTRHGTALCDKKMIIFPQELFKFCNIFPLDELENRTKIEQNQYLVYAATYMKAFSESFFFGVFFQCSHFWYNTFFKA